MSTKVYDGLCTTRLQSVVQFGDGISALHKHVESVVRSEMRRKLVSMAVLAYDELCVLGSTGLSLRGVESCSRLDSRCKLNTLTAASFCFENRIRHACKSPMRDPEFDFAFSMSFGVVDGLVLAIPYAEKKSVIEAVKNFVWRGDKLFMDFSYWDNADQPESVSEAEWDLRGSYWGEYDSVKVCLSGVDPVYNLYDVRFASDDFDHHLSFEDRVYRLAEYRVLSSHNVPQALNDLSSPGSVISAAFDFLGSSAFQESLKVESEFVSDRLAKQVTMDELHAEFDSSKFTCSLDSSDLDFSNLNHSGLVSSFRGGSALYG